MSKSVRIIGTSFLFLSISLLFFSCDLFGTKSYTVTYHANGAGSGTVPIDDNEYKEGQEVTVRGNAGDLEKNGHTFGGWNINSDGSGTKYSEGKTLFMSQSNLSLYAHWIPVFVLINKVDPNRGVNYPLEVEYIANPEIINEISFYWTFGRDTTIDPDREYNLIKTVSNPNDGSFTFNTDFTGRNWVTIKGVGQTKDGKTYADVMWFNIDNIGPQIYASPREHSVLQEILTIEVRLTKGGGTGACDFSHTEIVLTDVSQNNIPIDVSLNSENGVYSISPVAPLELGEYSISVVAFDDIGNESEFDSSFKKVNYGIDNPPEITIHTPSWENETVSGTIELTYSATDELEKLILDSSNFQNPLMWGSFPSTSFSNPQKEATIEIDTSFTGRNICSFRLFAVFKNGLTSTSNVVTCRIDNSK